MIRIAKGTDYFQFTSLAVSASTIKLEGRGRLVTIVPGHGEYATGEGEGWGYSVRQGQRVEHFPNRAQAWERAKRLTGRPSVAEVVS